MDILLALFVLEELIRLILIRTFLSHKAELDLFLYSKIFGRTVARGADMN